MEGSWPKFLAKNILKIILLTIGISMMTFGLMKASPVDPLQANVGQAALGSMSQEQREKLEEYWGVHTPPAQQYISWAKDFVRGDMGISLLYRQPVTEVIGVKLSNSLFLMIAAWVISGILGLFLGVVAGMNRGKLIDKAIQGYCLVGAAAPACFRSMASAVSHWSQRAYRSGSQRSDPGRPDLSCHTPGADLKHYRCLQHRPAHPGKNGGYHGKRLCFVCQDAGGERMAPV